VVRGRQPEERINDGTMALAITVPREVAVMKIPDASPTCSTANHSEIIFQAGGKVDAGETGDRSLHGQPSGTEVVTRRGS